MSFWASSYVDLFHPQADMRRLSGEDLLGLLSRPTEVFQVNDKRTLQMWSPVRLNPPRRAKRNVVAASCLVLDYDDGTTVEAAMQTWSPWYRILHTSWQHHPEAHRFRVVLPLLRDVTPDEYVVLWRWAEAHCERTIDKSCKDISRAWLLPSVDVADVGHCRRFRVEVEGGVLLDPAEVMPLAPAPLVSSLPPAIRLAELPDYRGQRGLPLDPDSRKELGHALGGVVNEECVRMVECPRCRRSAVWWWLDPTRQINAYCNHRQSCGWKGPVAALLADNMTFGSMEQ